MNANKLFSEFSLKKIWSKLKHHDKIINSISLVLLPSNWVLQENNTYTNTVSHKGFKSTDQLTVDLYDDGTLTDLQLTEYEEYIDEFDIIDGALVATANTAPTQTLIIVVRGEFASLSADVEKTLEDCFQSVSNGKALLASAITDKRIPTDARDTFQQMKENIDQIVLGSGNATVGDVLSGKTFTNDDGIEYTGTLTLSGTANPGQVLDGKTFYKTDPKNAVTGTMPNNGAVSPSALNCGGSYTIPAGYHNGSGKVTANTLASQTSATATAAQIKSGQTAWVNGTKITGTAKLAPTQQTGSVVVKAGYAGNTQHSVVFTNAFASTPTVSITDAGTFNISSITPSKTGFTFNAIRKTSGNTTSATCTWSAAV